MLEVSYTVKGTAQLIGRLKKTSDAFNNPEPFIAIGKQYLKWISANFADKGQTFGEPWPPLSPVTIKIKRKLYAQGKSKAITQPLVRTGALKKSFTFDVEDRRKVIISSTKQYAEVHQTGGKVMFKGQMRTIPKRVLIALDDKHTKSVEKIFDNWIKTLLEKQGFSDTKAIGGWTRL